MALAYFLTWTTYGTWLRGDPRGSVGENRRFLDPYPEPDPDRHGRDQSSLSSEPVVFTAQERVIVDDAIRAVCKHRGWRLLARNARSNHVHAVVVAPCPPEKVMGDFKAWATRRLREHNARRFAGRVWTMHGSTRHMFDEVSVAAAIEYVVNGQDDPARFARPAPR